jgi:glycolate oxidase subunit GlcD
MPVSPIVIDALTNIVGAKWIKTSASACEPYSSDGLPTLRSVPGAVVLPGTAEEVVRIVRVLAHHATPFVGRGAGTGLSGGGLGDQDSVVVVLTRLNRIIELNAADRFAIVEPGVVNIRLTEAASRHGLFYAPDPSSQTACTLGGNIAENAGGPHCMKYGVTSNHVLSLKVVLPDGTVTTLGSDSGQPWGLDLVSAFVGSEGMFGLVLEMTLKLLPAPQFVTTILADFSSMRDAGEVVTDIVGSPVVPAALEMIDQNCIKAVEESIYAAGFPTDAAAVLLVEIDGHSEDEVKEDASLVTNLLKGGCARSIKLATESSERERLWHGRKKAFGALGRISPDLIVQDAVVPRTALPDILDEIARIAHRHDVKISNVFHAGDGNLHPNINFDSKNTDEVKRVAIAANEIMEICLAAGGTLTGEHGIGMDKVRFMTDLFDTDSLSAMAALRRAFDPAGIANPGKVLPTHSCSEWKPHAAVTVHR